MTIRAQTAQSKFLELQRQRDNQVRACTDISNEDLELSVTQPETYLGNPMIPLNLKTNLFSTWKATISTIPLVITGSFSLYSSDVHATAKAGILAGVSFLIGPSYHPPSYTVLLAVCTTSNPIVTPIAG